MEDLFEQDHHAHTKKQINVDVPNLLLIGDLVGREQQLLRDQEEQRNDGKGDECSKRESVGLERVPSDSCDHPPKEQRNDRYAAANAVSSLKSLKTSSKH